MTSSEICKTCRKPKAAFQCGLCHENTCKACAQFIDENTFSFLPKVPEELQHSCYCGQCFDEKVSTPLQEYEETLEKAKDLIIYTKEQTKITRLLKREHAPYKVEDCEDEQEAIVRLAFFAVQDNFNALIDVEVKNHKIIVGSHKKTVFSAQAVPVHLDTNKYRGDRG